MACKAPASSTVTAAGSTYRSALKTHVPFLYTSAALVNHQSYLPPWLLLSTPNPISILPSCLQTIIITYNISATSKSCPYPLPKIMSFHFPQIASCAVSIPVNRSIGLNDFWGPFHLWYSVCNSRAAQWSLYNHSRSSEKVRVIEESFLVEMWRLNRVLNNGKNLSWQMDCLRLEKQHDSKQGGGKKRCVQSDWWEINLTGIVCADCWILKNKPESKASNNK